MSNVFWCIRGVTPDRPLKKFSLKLCEIKGRLSDGNLVLGLYFTRGKIIKCQKFRGSLDKE